jgi:hypothetical protein
MKVRVEQAGIGGREIQLHISAESPLESIALRAWYDQRAVQVNNTVAMPERFFLLCMPFEFPNQGD